MQHVISSPATRLATPDPSQCSAAINAGPGRGQPARRPKCDMSPSGKQTWDDASGGTSHLCTAQLCIRLWHGCCPAVQTPTINSNSTQTHQPVLSLSGPQQEPHRALEACAGEGTGCSKQPRAWKVRTPEATACSVSRSTKPWPSRSRRHRCTSGGVKARSATKQNTVRR